MISCTDMVAMISLMFHLHCRTLKPLAKDGR
jgi:hypothetical protein